MSASKEADQLGAEGPVSEAPETSDQEAAQNLSVNEELATLRSELATAREKIQQDRDELLRARAEMDNVRKRAARDVEAARRFGLERLMSDLLEVNDGLERGLDAAQAEETTVAQLREGKILTLKLLQKVLSQHGLVAIDPQGEKFDPDRHEAMSIVVTAEQAPDTVVTVIQKGYVLNDRLLRPARVMVASAPEC